MAGSNGNTKPVAKTFSVDDACNLYGVDKWGPDHFEIGADGELGLKNPRFPDRPATSLYQIVGDLEERGIHAPVLISPATLSTTMGVSKN